MFVIRSEQMTAMRRLGWASFGEEMWDHLQEYFPIDSELMGEI